MRKFKKGDKVRVYSLQSFQQGGFINGHTGTVKQDQTSESVIVQVVRNLNGTMMMDDSYEVYPEQLRLIDPESKVEERRLGDILVQQHATGTTNDDANYLVRAIVAYVSAESQMAALQTSWFVRKRQWKMGVLIEQSTNALWSIREMLWKHVRSKKDETS